MFLAESRRHLRVRQPACRRIVEGLKVGNKQIDVLNVLGGTADAIEEVRVAQRDEEPRLSALERAPEAAVKLVDLRDRWRAGKISDLLGVVAIPLKRLVFICRRSVELIAATLGDDVDRQPCSHGVR